MRVMDGAGQFHFENLIKRFNCLRCGFLVHASSCCYSNDSLRAYLIQSDEKHRDTKTQRHKGPQPSSAPLCLCVFVSLCFYCAFEVTVFPIGEWPGIAETPSS